MSTENTYDAPKGNVEQPEEYTEVKILALNGRLGRARYIAYVMGLGLFGGLARGLFGAIGACGAWGSRRGCCGRWWYCYSHSPDRLYGFLDDSPGA